MTTRSVLPPSPATTPGAAAPVRDGLRPAEPPGRRTLDVTARGPDPAVRFRLGSLGLPAVAGEEENVARVAQHPISGSTFAALQTSARRLGVTTELRDVVDHFGTPAGHTPQGFRVELDLESDGLLRADLVRDIGYYADGIRRPTNVLYSADTANPYEIAPIAPLIANLTCNPGIIYDLFLGDPAANIGGAFSTRDEVMTEIGRILGPGCDISVELDNPFADPHEVLEEAEHFREMLSRWRVVIKVPHTGPVNAGNAAQLLTGDKRLDRWWWEPSTADAFHGHRLALLLHEHGFRVNFTLMFEPHQTQLALQARPAYVNAFIRHRLTQSTRLAALLDAHAASGDDGLLVTLRDYLLGTDHLPAGDTEHDLADCRRMAERIVAHRRFREPEGADGLDSVRHTLRVLRSANLPETRLIVCSMEGERAYPQIDSLLASDEFTDMTNRVVVTAEPQYLARFASANQVVSYQRRFLNAAQRGGPRPG